MDGLYFFDDADGITLFWFSRDGRVVSMVKSNLFDQHLKTYSWFKIDSDINHFSRGIYKVDIWDNIRIVIRGEHGRIVYTGSIRDDGTIDLYYRDPLTCFKKLVTYVRVNEEHHIIHKKLSVNIGLLSN